MDDQELLNLLRDIESDLGPTLRRWREEWTERLKKNPQPDLSLPQGRMQPVGYIVLQHSVRLDRPVKAYERWIGKIPIEYRNAVLNESQEDSPAPSPDPNRLLLLKHYHSLMPLAQEAHKPMFHLKAADGAIGAHLAAVQGVDKDFRILASMIAERTGISLPRLASQVSAF